MGCWNETCMLSHMQIMSGDDIQVIILVQNDNESNPCYYNTNYAPLILPFTAEYDDYGGIVTKDNYIPFYSSVVLENSKFVYENDEEYKYKTVDDLVREITTDSCLYLFRENCCDRKRRKCKLECVYVHKQLYDILVENFKSRKPCNRNETLYDLWKDTYKTIINNLHEVRVLKKMKNEDALIKALDIKYITTEMMYKMSQHGYDANRAYMNIIDKYEIDMDAFADDMTNYIMFAYSLEYGRYGYLSRCGAGGQDADVRVQKLVAQFILDFSERTWYFEDSKVYTEDESCFWYDR